jgi:hypothetical protein
VNCPTSIKRETITVAEIVEEDLQRLLGRISERLPASWASWPGGWPNQIELALIDAVLSIRSRYGSPTTGVRKRVALYRQLRTPAAPDDLNVLARFSSEQLADVLQTTQRSAGELKTAAIVQVARRLTEAGVIRAADLRPDDVSQAAAYCGVRGLGPVTWQYLLMLVGNPGVKADTWILRFVTASLGRAATTREAEHLVKVAALRLDVSPTDLDHAIWNYMSRRG